MKVSVRIIRKNLLQFYMKIKGYGSNPPQFPFCKSFAAFIETDLIKNGVARHTLDIYDKTFFHENYCVDKTLFTYPAKLCIRKKTICSGVEGFLKSLKFI